MTTIRFTFASFFFSLAFALFAFVVRAEDTGGLKTIQNAQEEEAEIEPAYAVLFPPFTLTLGVVIYIVLTRYIKALPYTAVMFLLGTAMGIWAELAENSHDHITESLRLWIPINSEVLLLVFLPGLIFKDAFGLNVHLFVMSFVQCVIFAFPLVLAGAVLTALVAYYIFPYDWSLDLCLAFGSILAATDPVAVTALLEQMGAPPRLKIHIYGESLLNDGSAIVFFSIFSERFYYLLNIEGLGKDIGWAEGFGMFFKQSLGAVAIGLAFGFGLLLLFRLLSHRLNRNENVVEVVATVAIAYTGYYVASYVCKTSGIISTLTTGVTIKFLGRALINDMKLLTDFGLLCNKSLDTVLFALGGVVWGAVIARGEQDGVFTGTDWGYLILFYVLFIVIRAILFLAAYPVTKRIGLSTNMKETAFLVHGGLRGAVAIALALSLDNNVQSVGADEVFSEQTTVVFAMVGGIAFLTLVINGVTAAPFIKHLGLTQSSESRKKILNTFQTRYKLAMVDEMVRLLTQVRFHEVNFALVKHHVPLLRDLTRQQLRDAVEKHRDTTPSKSYKAPFLKRILPYLPEDEHEEKYQKKLEHEQNDDILDTNAYMHDSNDQQEVEQHRRQSKMRSMMPGDPLSTKEMRLLFLSILKAAYETQLNDGELEEQEFLTVALYQSLDYAEDEVSKGEPIKDWDHVISLDNPLQALYHREKHIPFLKSFFSCIDAIWSFKHTARRFDIERSLALMEAHRWAEDFFQKEFQVTGDDIIEEGKAAMSESRCQSERAAEVFDKYDGKDVSDIISHKFCSIVINSAVDSIEKLVESGLMQETEAEERLSEMENQLREVRSCHRQDHPAELPVSSYDDKEEQERARRQRPDGSN